MDATIERIRGKDLIRRGPFARLFWSQFISSLGDWVTLFATFALAARIAGGGRAAPLAILVPLVARILPGLVIGVVGGVVADRWDRKRTMVVADLGRALLVVVLLFVGNFRDLFAISFAIEVLSLIRQPSRESVVPSLIPHRHLMAANGLNLIAAYATAPLGSALFAVLADVGSELMSFAAHPGVAAAFAFDAVTFVVSGIIVMTIPIERIRLATGRRARNRMDFRAPLRDMADGFLFVAGFAAVRRTVIGMALGLFGGGALFVLGQPFATQLLLAGDTGYGVLVTALGVGVGLGMVGMTLWGRRVLRREPLFATSLLVTGISIVLASFMDDVWLAAGWVFAAGVATGIAYVTGFTHLHAAITDDIRGRTFAALFASARAALLISFGLAGAGAATLQGVFPGPLANGIRAVMVLSGLTIVVAGTGGLWAVREQLRGDPLDEESYRTLRDAGDAFTWMRGDRRDRQ